MKRRGNKRRGDPAERRARVRAAAGRTLSVAARVVLAAALGGAALGGGVFAWRWALTSPRLAVTEVHVTGNARASLRSLAPLTGISRGQNIFRIDADRTERDLATHPWVAAAAVRRELPGTVHIAVREHRPAALAALGSVYLVSDEGVPFKRLVPGDPVDLPVITGIEAEGMPLETLRARLREGLEVAEAFAASALAAEAWLAEVHLDPVRGASLTVLHGPEAHPTVAHLGRTDAGRRLARLARLLGRLAERGDHPKEVFLDNHSRPRWVVARME